MFASDAFLFVHTVSLVWCFTLSRFPTGIFHCKIFQKSNSKMEIKKRKGLGSKAGCSVPCLVKIRCKGNLGEVVIKYHFFFIHLCLFRNVSCFGLRVAQQLPESAATILWTQATQMLWLELPFALKMLPCCPSLHIIDQILFVFPLNVLLQSTQLKERTNY